jgi:heptaprenyl diphosphate synthase
VKENVSVADSLAGDRAFITVFPAYGKELRLGQDLSTVLGWLREYVSEPSSQIGRTGPICPFVPSALRDNAVRFSFYYGIDGSNPADVRELLIDELREFDSTAAPASRAGTSLASLLVVLPDTGRDGWAVMDEVYGDLKEFAVGHALMVGQFHPICAEPAVRNPAFPVSRSPVGLFAARRMAPHDILFLHADPQWFGVYQERFGEHFRRGKVRDPFMRQLYAEASGAFGRADAA